ncbi:MAG: DUF4912 domain-containing protein [Verrucomicrobiae bacterium]|nr:DUF4912 domain-containing protein [Verrucomicrobiae bacterium]
MQKPKSAGSKTRRSKSAAAPAVPAPAAAREAAPKSNPKSNPKADPKAPDAVSPKGGGKGMTKAPAPAEGATRAPSASVGASGAKPATSGRPAVPAASPAPPPSAPLPPILLEGDVDRGPTVGGPGDRYVTGPAPAKGLAGAQGVLPSAYGTGRMLLLARDPHWIYAHWDLTDEQLREHNRKSASGRLTLRVYGEALEGKPLLEQEVHPESRNWFLHVPRAGARYLAELGYYGRREAWTRVAISGATLTPGDGISPETWVRFETLPFDMPMATLVAMVREAAGEHVPLLEALAAVRDRVGIEWPSAEAVARREWTVEQERALAQAISIDEMRRVWIGSLEITELLRRQLARGISSGEWPVSSFGAGEVSSVTSLASPFGGAAESRRGFWFNVNAELIVYGATDPRATVRIGERTIRLRPDGTFSYRFALPDGDYALPIRATSPDEVETRSAALTFRRASEYRGEVGRHPQDGTLRTPGPEHVG